MPSSCLRNDPTEHVWASMVFEPQVQLHVFVSEDRLRTLEIERQKIELKSGCEKI